MYLKSGFDQEFHPRRSKKNCRQHPPTDLVTYICTSLDNHKVPVHAQATAHVSPHIPEISPHISAAWDKHPDWATLRDSIIAGAASAANYGYPWDETAHINCLTSLWGHQRLLAVEKLMPRLLWFAQLTDIFIEMILRFLQISGVR